ncbi:MAG: hypothetical protein ACKVP0_10805 [Pirellulaceae bacterium]
MAPAIALVITGALGLLLAIVGVVIAFSPAPPVNPNAPPAMQSLQRGGHGPAAVVVQGLFVLVNGFIIFGAVQTMRQKMRGLGIAASVAAMLNFANCCCLLGIPIGIWSLVILMQDDVKRAFDANANSY